MKTKKSSSIEDELIGEILESESNSEISVSLAREKTNVPDEKTVKLKTSAENSDQKSASILTSLSKIMAPKSRPGSSVMGTAEASLVQADNLRIAQDRINELEEEIENIREENMKLATAGEALNNRVDELLAKSNQLENKMSEDKKSMAEELKLLQGLTAQKDKEREELKKLNNAMETRLDTNLRKIRLRERELENRLEILKMESHSIVNSKNKIILDLKKEIDQYSYEIENFRIKGLELNKKLENKQEAFKKTVRTLKIALSLLDGQLDIQSVENKEKAS